MSLYTAFDGVSLANSWDRWPFIQGTARAKGQTDFLHELILGLLGSQLLPSLYSLGHISLELLELLCNCLRLFLKRHDGKE